jgi:hypothetical protein
MLLREKRKHQAESRKKEKEVAVLARERQHNGEGIEFETLLANMQSARAYTFEVFSALLHSQWNLTRGTSL